MCADSSTPEGRVRYEGGEEHGVASKTAAEVRAGIGGEPLYGTFSLSLSLGIACRKLLLEEGKYVLECVPKGVLEFANELRLQRFWVYRTCYTPERESTSRDGWLILRFAIVF